MGKAKRQHWVPRFYLNEFATPESRDLKHPKVWAFSKNKDDGFPFQTALENIALEKFLYSPLKEDGSRDYEVEDDLSELESLIARRWKIIANNFDDFSKDSATRKIVALFMATLLLRHPKQLETTKMINQRMAELYHAAPRNDQGKPNISLIGPSGEVLNVDMSDWNKSDDLKEAELRELFASNIRDLGGGVAKDLLDKRWGIICSEEPIFCTSDNPVAIINSERSFGIKTKGTVVLFPLSPTRVLILDDKHEEQDGGYYPTKPGAQEFVCGAMWITTHRFLIAPRDPLELLAGVVRSHEQEQAAIEAAWPIKRHRIGRNDRCPCGSGRKWKHCCGKFH